MAASCDILLRHGGSAAWAATAGATLTDHASLLHTPFLRELSTPPRIRLMDSILVHGLRQRRINGGGCWFERLTSVIKGRWPAPTASAGTQSAERGLGISDKPYYFYALRADRRFGSVVFLLREIDGVNWPPDARGATPFDSGGMWFGKIATNPPLDKSGWRSLFKAHDVPLVAWRSAFETYIGTRYSTVADYVRGIAPTSTHAQDGYAIVMGEPNEPRAWTWEVRVPHQLAPDHLELQAVCLSEERRNLYLDWLWDDSSLTTSERRKIDAWLQDYAIVPSPGLSEVDRAGEWLVRRLSSEG